MIALKKDHPKCKACKHYDDCDEKRMVACAMMEPPMLERAAQNVTLPVSQDIAVKHDYRDVWVDKDTTVTIDLEDIKKQIEREIYKSLYKPLECNFMSGA